MSTSKKPPAADGPHGGPGSSGQDANKPARPTPAEPDADEPTNPRHSRVSGSARDSHHTHDPAGKDNGRG
jgi:hypothetical protein